MDRIGKYEVLDKIGSGGFAVVYKGYDPFIKRPVAIKVCYSRDEETRQRFFREAEIAGRLVHKNLTTVYDFGLHENMPYLVEEYLSGEDLAHMIRRREPESLAEKLDFLIQIALGLDYAHSQGVIHRDIKPANIRVLENGLCKIMDFGTAKLANVESHLTQTGMTLGTVAYLSPERLLGHDVGLNSDLFSFGVLAYELLTFHRPFSGRNIPSLIDQVLNAAPVPMVEHWPQCPPRLEEVVGKTLAKDPDVRYASCTEMIRDFEEILEGMTGAGTPQSGQLGLEPQIAVQLSGLLERARQLIHDGKVPRAEMLLEEVLEIDPENQPAQQMLEECRVASEAVTAQPPPPVVEAPPWESAEERRDRKVNEAVVSIEKYIAHQELRQAVSALRFAAKLLGPFDPAHELQNKLLEVFQRDLLAFRAEGSRRAKKIAETARELAGRGVLSPADGRRLSDLARDLDPGVAFPELPRPPAPPKSGTDVGTGALTGKAEARMRKQAEAVASIERLLADGDARQAEQALRFAVRLFGEFDELPLLEHRIQDALRSREV